MRSRLLLFPLVLSTLLASASAQKPLQAEAAQAVKAAGKDVTKLVQLAQDWTTQKRADAARLAWKRVVELEPDHEPARAGLNHVRYDGKWFEGQTALLDYKRAEDSRMQKQGLLRVGDRFVPIADAPFLRLGWTRDEQGQWLHPLTRLRLEEDQRQQARGCQQQDLVWVEPAEFETWKRGLWKCGTQWLDTAAADAFHADSKQPWMVASEHFVISTTVDRERVEWCKWYADRTVGDLVRIFGVRPGERPSAIDLYGPKRNRPELVIWSSLAQYNAFTGNSESQGLSSLHYACFVDGLFDPSVSPPAFAGLGCGFWDKNPQLDAFGQHAIRHAAAQSFVEAIDPSWQALGEQATARPVNAAKPTQAQAQAQSQAQTQAFWRDKRIPRWLRYGACAYVERWFVEPDARDGQNPEWSRQWAKQALQKGGGLRDLAKVFECKLDTTDAAGSTQRIQEAGCVVAFLLDGGDAGVQKAHRAFQVALQGDGSTAAAAADLQRALLAAERDLRAFATR